MRAIICDDDEIILRGLRSVIDWASLGIELVERPLASETSDFARHSIARLAAAVMELHGERSMRVVPELGAEDGAFILEDT